MVRCQSRIIILSNNAPEEKMEEYILHMISEAFGIKIKLSKKTGLTLEWLDFTVKVNQYQY